MVCVCVCVCVCVRERERERERERDGGGGGVELLISEITGSALTTQCRTKTNVMPIFLSLTTDLSNMIASTT